MDITKQNSAFLAGLFEVRNSTISDWVKKGMPVYKPGGGRGLENEFHLPHVLRWEHAKNRLNNRNLPLMDTITMVLLGDALFAGDGQCTTFESWKDHAMKLVHELGGNKSDFDAAVTALIRDGLLDGAFQLYGLGKQKRIA